jgi:hypothetical protein
MAYKRAEPKYGLSVEKGTERVPDDNRYHLIVDGEIVLSTGVEALALIELDEFKAARQARGRELMRREKAEFDVHASRSMSFSEMQSRDQRKGGRGIGRR